MSVAVRHPKLLLAGIALAIFTLAFNVTTFYNLVPLFIQTFKLTTTDAQWLINSYLLAIITLVILGGKLGDKWGRKRVFIVGCLIFAVGALLISLSSGFNGLLTGRIVQGLGLALAFPGSSALIKDAFPEEKQAGAFSVWSAASGLGLALGPVISGVTTHLVNWRIIFIITLLIMFIPVSLIKLLAPNYRKESQHEKFDFYGLILLIISVFALVLGLIEGNNWGWQHFNTLACLLLGFIVLIIFIAVESRAQHPLVNLKLFANKFYTYGLLGLFAYAVAMNLLLFFFNIFIQYPLLSNYNTQQAGLAVLPFCAAYFAGSLLVPVSMKIIKEELALMSLAFLLIAAGFFPLFYLLQTTNYTFFILPLFCIGLACGISQALLPKIAMVNLPAHHVGEASGMIVKSIYLGVIFAIAIGGIIYHINYQNGFLHLLQIHQIAPLQQQQLFQQYSSVNHYLNHASLLSAPLKTVINAALQNAEIKAFSSTMLFAGLVGLFMLFYSLLLLNKRKKIVNH